MNNAEHALSLLTRLTQIEPLVFAPLLRARAIAVNVRWPAVELAQALSHPNALAHHLQQLPRETLDALTGCVEHPDQTPHPSALETLLVHSTPSGWALLPGVEQVWSELRSQRESDAVPRRPGPAVGENAATIDLTVVGEFLETLEAIATRAGQSAREFAGHPAESERGAQGALPHHSQESIESATDCARRIGLVTPREGRLWLSSFGASWLESDLATRWQGVLERWWSQCPSWWRDTLRTSLDAGDSAQSWEEVLQHYPLLSHHSVQRVVDEARALGVISGGSLTEIGRALARGESLAEELNRALPKPTSQLYPDGPDTLIAAGRLEAGLEEILRRAGEWESGCLSPRFRLSPRSVIRWVSRGHDGERLLQTLRQALPRGGSATVLHDIAQALSRAHALSLRAGSGHVVLASDDPVILQVIAADYALRALSWREEGAVLVSACGLNQVDELLNQEGYWHLVSDASGEPLPVRARWSTVESTDTASWDESTAAALCQGLREELSGPTGFEHALMLAIGHKVALHVTVSVGDEHRVLSVEPSGLKNGRLRGRDLRAEVERTIPLDQIVAISPSAA